MTNSHENPLRGFGERSETKNALRYTQFAAAVDVLEKTLSQQGAADHFLDVLFRKQRQMGVRDRARVKALVYGVLREHRRWVVIAQSEDARALCASCALELALASHETLRRFGVEDIDTLHARVHAAHAQTLSPAQAVNVPDALFARWTAQYGAAQAYALGAALQTQAAVDLRVNVQRTTREAAKAALAAAGVEAQPTPLSPWGLRLATRAPLQTLALFREGAIEPQDEGSQLIALLVGAGPGDRVVDFCAGAGGKTLALAAQMAGRGELWALDTESTRLQRLAPRAQRAGVNQLRVLAIEEVDSGFSPDSIPAELQSACDAVLVDAPCSGTGTWRRQPEARLKPVDFDALATNQLVILDRAAALVRPGGTLVYATCSVMQEENQQVVARFLEGHAEFCVEAAAECFAASGIDLPGQYMQLLPHVHGTDGFFAARMRRRT